MDKLCFEDSLNLFWDECDTWIESRQNEIAAMGVGLSEADMEKIEVDTEAKINALLEKLVTEYGESFSPDILKDIHHLFFELELKKTGVSNEDKIHRYKDNAQVGLSCAEAGITPDNAMLVIELNRAHLEKKGGDNEGICDDCICGKK